MIRHALSLMAMVTVLSAAPGIAKDRQLTPDEARIATAFDIAVRQDASLKALSSLPWADGAAIWKPVLMQNLRYCKQYHAGIYGNKIYLLWEEAVDPADTAHPCGNFGYFAILEFKKGRIKRVTFGESDIVVT